MASSGESIAKKLSLGRPFHGPAGKPAVKRSKRNANKYSGGGGRRVSPKPRPKQKKMVNTNAASGGGGRRIPASGKKSVTKQEVLAFNKLSDAARKKSPGKIARFKAAGYGVFEDYSVHTSGKGFGKFFDKTGKKFKQMKAKTSRTGPPQDKPTAKKKHSKNPWTA